MFYTVASMKIPLSKRKETMELMKKLRDHLNETYSDVAVEILSSLSVGEEMLFVEKFDSKAAWAVSSDARKEDKVLPIPSKR